jgi:hypothetical protein
VVRDHRGAGTDQDSSGASAEVVLIEMFFQGEDVPSANHCTEIVQTDEEC